MSTAKTYAVLYLRPDGWWIASEGWTDRAEAKADAAEALPSTRHKVVVVGGEPYRRAAGLDAARRGH